MTRAIAALLLGLALAGPSQAEPCFYGQGGLYGDAAGTSCEAHLTPFVPVATYLVVRPGALEEPLAELRITVGNLPAQGAQGHVTASWNHWPSGGELGAEMTWLFDPPLDLQGQPLLLGTITFTAFDESWVAQDHPVHVETSLGLDHYSQGYAFCDEILLLNCSMDFCDCLVGCGFIEDEWIRVRDAVPAPGAAVNGVFPLMFGVESWLCEFLEQTDLPYAGELFLNGVSIAEFSQEGSSTNWFELDVSNLPEGAPVTVAIHADNGEQTVATLDYVVDSATGVGHAQDNGSLSLIKSLY